MEVKWDGLLFVASGADEDGIFTLQVFSFELSNVILRLFDSHFTTFFCDLIFRLVCLTWQAPVHVAMMKTSQLP